MSTQKRQLFDCFKQLNDSFSVVRLYIFEENLHIIRIAISYRVEWCLSQLRILEYP